VTHFVETAMSTAIPAPLKATVTAKVEALLTDVLAPRHLIPRPPGYRWAYPVALSCRWWRFSCYLCATYRRPYPDGAVEDVEERFARLDYRGRTRFALASFRHTERWLTVSPDLSLSACLQAIATQELFWP
jgi:hypothetical protein